MNKTAIILFSLIISLFYIAGCSNNNVNNTVILIILDINNDKEIKVNFITDF